MTERYTTPEKGTHAWHRPLNENPARLDQDVEVRDREANRANYEPTQGKKFLATDSNAVYFGDGGEWVLAGYIARDLGGDVGHYVNYPDGLSAEEINKFVFSADERLEITRIAAPMKGVSPGQTDADVTLTVYEGGLGGTKLVEVEGNETKSAVGRVDGAWSATTSPVVVAVTNASGQPVDLVPRISANVLLE